ncbi:MAG TPA: RluA family pseudouridine synthase [Acidimicrobiales bacterium]|jgi:23S rRNA pseudouridine1911/1915/1917 synthase
MTGLSVEVPASLDGVRVDRAVALLADVSRSAVELLIAEGRVRVDDEPVQVRSRVLRAGQQLSVELEPIAAPLLPEPDSSVAFTVVHADDEIIVVDKPAGLVVHPGAGNRTGTLVNGLLARFPDLASLVEPNGLAVPDDEADFRASDIDRPGIVHRLDRGTSGLLVVARTRSATASLVGQLTDRTVVREYVSLVHGTVESPAGIVDAPIGRSETSPTRMAVTQRGKPARTRYQVEARSSRPLPVTLVAATLETGRTHQIRVHLAAIGHPVVADDLYGLHRPIPGTDLRRPFLHARSLGFVHPGTGEHVSWSSGLPLELQSVLAVLED